LSLRSWALWSLGYPEAALTDAEHALKDAREVGQAATLMYALSFTLWTNIFCGNYATAAAQAQELAALAEEKDAMFWKALGMMDQGCIRNPYDHLRDHRLVVNGINTKHPVVFTIFGDGLCGTRPIR